ncbi:T9SS type A sorting domain-containing protein [Maribacter sp.]|uniref:T9SS type A sorting domain-containing protein n=1 Tax=Maribacter sp. TaxID=1897614 RepID=UPI0025BF5D7D|nr:T9SS type A sorting domain-containing protein [Maribacter sp.]
MNRLILTLLITFLFSIAINAQSNSIKNELVKTSVKVFPNPATNVVNVLGLQNSNTSSITILDTYGNIVLRHIWEIRNNAINIPISSLTPGIYIITIQSKEQQIQTKFYKK